MDENSIKSNYNGILYTLVDKGQYITKGTLLGYTTDYWGNILEEYHSPFTGLVLTVIVVPVINKGEQVFNVAKVVDKFEE